MRSLLLCAGVALALVVPTRSSAQNPDGTALYRENCRTCHGTAGKPTHMALTQYPKIPSFADAAFIRTRSEDSIVAVLQHGAGKDMKSFKDKLTHDEMMAVARYVRTFAGGAPKAP